MAAIAEAASSAQRKSRTGASSRTSTGPSPGIWRRIVLTTLLFATRDNVLRWLATEGRGAALPAAAAVMLGGAVTLFAFLVARRHVSAAAIRAEGRWFVLPGLLFGISYAFAFEAYFRGRVTIVSPLVATESLFGVLFAVLLLRRSELVGRHVLVGAALVVAGAALIGATR